MAEVIKATTIILGNMLATRILDSPIMFSPIAIIIIPPVDVISIIKESNNSDGTNFVI